MKTQKLMFRWSLLTGVLIALFLVICYLSTGSVPIVTSVQMTKTWTMPLPFGISRWWDVLIGPTWSIIIIYLLTKQKDKNKDWIFGLIIGLIFGLIIGLGAGLVADQSAGLLIALLVGLGAGLLTALLVGLGVGLIIGLLAGLGVSLGVSLVACPLTALLVGLVACLVFGIFALIKLVANKSFWINFGNWMMAK